MNQDHLHVNSIPESFPSHNTLLAVSVQEGPSKGDVAIASSCPNNTTLTKQPLGVTGSCYKLEQP